jgi:lipopolysaccharide transport system ATP-binding protein
VSTERPIAIRVRNLAKVYKLYARPRHLIWELLTGRPKHTEFHALRDVSLDVPQGKVVGVIGRNGAGKSTLLKILAGTLDKTSGEVDVRGKISAILELGTGFHPDRTGRENILMGGLCLGMTKSEIAERTNEIIEFSELGQVIDRPFKTYSSGMQARLTFSTAVSVRPDIFIVDEALATGDLLFQEKCLRKMRAICESGATVLLVTHSLYHVYEMCDACVLIGEGRVLEAGEPRRVGEVYERLLWKDRQNSANAGFATSDKPPPAEAQVLSLCIATPDGNPTGMLFIGRRYRVEIRARFLAEVENPSVGFKVQTPSGTSIIGDATNLHDVRIDGRKGSEVVVAFEFTCRLAAGTYLLGGGVADARPGGDFRSLHFLRGAATMIVEGKPLNALVDPECEVTVTAS